jgi:hypothetical protein
MISLQITLTERLVCYSFIPASLPDMYILSQSALRSKRPGQHGNFCGNNIIRALPADKKYQPLDFFI